jgi:hypothetical protein
MNISTCNCTGMVQSIFKKMFVVANNLSYNLLPELKLCSAILQSMSLQKCVQIAGILSLFLLKVSKSVKVPSITRVFVKHILDILSFQNCLVLFAYYLHGQIAQDNSGPTIFQAKKSVSRPLADPPQTIGLSRLPSVVCPCSLQLFKTR